jgi:acyl-CoA dehydrogenase
MMIMISDEQKMLYQMVKEFADQKIWPQARELDSTSNYPKTLIDEAFQLGIVNAFVPESLGGLGQGVLNHCLIAEALAYGSAGVATAILANDLAAIPLILSQNETAYEKFLKPMAQNPLMAAYCVTEPNAGSDVAGLQTTAKKVKDHYEISGQKMWITNAGHASWFFVLARTSDEGAKGLTGFVVPADIPGVIVGKKEENMGQKCSDTRSVTFDRAVIPEAYRLGKEGEGFRLAMMAFDRTRPPVSACAVGLAERALKCSLDYVKERKTFGKVLSQHQSIAFMLAEMARDIEASRLLVAQSGLEVDKGRPNTYWASIGKLLSADMCMRVTTDAVQIFGGYGYNQEYPVEMLMRDAKIFQIYEGTSQIQRMIISRLIFEGKRPSLFE